MSYILGAVLALAGMVCGPIAIALGRWIVARLEGE